MSKPKLSSVFRLTSPFSYGFKSQQALNLVHNIQQNIARELFRRLTGEISCKYQFPFYYFERGAIDYEIGDVRALKWKMHVGLFLLFCGWGIFLNGFGAFSGTSSVQALGFTPTLL